MYDQNIYEKLTRYCAYQERTGYDARNKLQKLKVDKADFDSYIAKLKQDNFLNEERFVKSFVAAHSRKKWGKVKIKSALSQKGIDSSLTKKYIDLIEDEDYHGQITALIQKKWKTIRTGTARQKKDKLTRFLLSKGFEMGKIISAIKELQ